MLVQGVLYLVRRSGSWKWLFFCWMLDGSRSKPFLSVSSIILELLLLKMSPHSASGLTRFPWEQMNPTQSCSYTSEINFKLMQRCHNLSLKLREMWQRCSGLGRSDVSLWHTWCILTACLTLATPTFTSTVTNNCLHWCHISNAVTEEYRTGFSSFVLGVNLASAGSCADLMAPDNLVY